jgi:hypothetical protein
LGFEGRQTAKLAMNKSRAPFFNIAFTLNPKSYTDPIREIAHWSHSCAGRFRSERMVAFVNNWLVNFGSCRILLSESVHESSLQ